MADEHRGQGPHEVVVTHVKADGKWIKVFIQFNRFIPQQIQNILDNLSPHLEKSSGYFHQCQLPIGSVVCVRARNGKWYRGKVKSWISSNQLGVTVQFIDYGNSQEVNVGDLRKADDHIIQPDAQATECFLADIVAPDGAFWSEDAIQTCEGLICFKEKVICNVVHYAEKSPIVRVYHNHFLLSQNLIQMGFGVAVGNHLIEPRLMAKPSTPPGYVEPVAPPLYPVPSLTYPTNVATPVTNTVRESYQIVLLDKNCEYPVYVTHVNENGTFYVQLSESERERQTLSRSLNTYIISAPPDILQVFYPGTPCITRSLENQSFQRAMVLNVTGKECQVRFIDIGNTEKKYLMDLRVIPQEFLTLPVQALECSIKPITPSFDVGMFKQSVLGKLIQCHVLSRVDHQHIVNLFVNNRNLLDSLNANVLANQATPYLKTPSPPLPGYRYINLSARHSFEVRLTYIKSPVEFHVQLAANASQVHALSEQMTNYYEEKGNAVPIDKDQCVVGVAVCCVRSRDSRFYRAEVTSVPKGGRVEVKFVDIGDTEVVPVSQVLHLETKFLLLPAQAIELIMFGLEQYPSEVLESPYVISKLERLTSTNSLIAEVEKALENRRYSVVLRTADRNSLCINNMLIDEVEVPMPKIGKIEQLIITNFVSAENFFGQLSQICVEDFTNFGDELHNHYASIPPETLMPVKNQFVVAKFSENDTFYRGKVLSIKKGMAEVLYLDYGNKEFCEPVNIYSLAPKFSEMPQMGINCCFTQIPQTLRHEMLAEIMPDSTIEVEILEKTDTLFQVRLTNNELNAGLLKLFKPPERVIQPYISPKVPVGALMQVIVTDVRDFDSFTCQLQKDMELLEEMMASLDSSYKALNPNDLIYKALKVSTPCVAKYSEDECWYRAEVSEPPAQGSCNVLFVDYGNYERVPINEVKEILDEYLKLPIYSIQCSLNDVTTTNKSPEDLAKFKEQVTDIPLTGVFSGLDPLSKKYKVELLDQLGESIGISFLEAKKAPVNPPEDMWAESKSSDKRGAKAYGHDTRFNSRDDRNSAYNGEGENHNSFRSGGGNYREERPNRRAAGGSDFGRNDGKGRRRDSERSETHSSSDESKGRPPRSITKKNVEEIPIFAEYQHVPIKNFTYSDIVVTHVVNPREFYGQMTESCSQLLPLIDELNEAYGNGSGCEPVPKMKPGDPCAALNSDDNTWYRGTVYNMLGHRIEVQFVDYGNVELIPLSDVKQLKPQFFKLPVQALKLSLVNVAPPDGRTWSEEVVNAFKERVFDKCIVAQFLESKGKSSYTVSLIDANVMHAKNMDQELVALGLCKFETNQQSQTPVVAPIATIKPLEVTIGTQSSVSVTWFKSYTKFFCQIESPPFTTLMEKINNHYGSMAVFDSIVERPLPGMVCASQFSEDQCWYRSQVLYTKRNRVGVFYVDFGNCDEVARKYIKKLDQQFENMPRQGILCYLKNVHSEETPTPEALPQYFGGAITCTFVDKTEDGYVIEAECNGVNIAESLLANGLVQSVIPKVAYLPVKSNVVSPYTKISLDNREYEVFAIYTESPHKFYCQQSAASIQLDELMERIQLQYADKEEENGVVEVSVGSKAFVAKYSEDNRWYRVAVLSVTDEEAQVLFVDYGNEESVSKAVVKECLPEFIELPEQAFECCMYGVPADIPENQANQFYEAVDNKEFTIRVQDTKEGIFLVSALDKTASPPTDIGIKIFGPPLLYPSEPMSEISTEASAALSVEPSMAISAEPIVEISAEPIVEISAEPIVEISAEPIAEISVPNQNLTYQSVAIPKGEEKVVITHVDSVKSFYLHLEAQDRLTGVVEDLLVLLEENGQHLPNPTPGAHCCAKYSEDDKFYRAVILSINDQLATIFFIDYGNTDVCELKDIFQLNQNLVRFCPTAVQCSLNGFEPVEGSETEIVNQLSGLTEEKFITAKFLSSEIPLLVDLFDNEINLGNILLEKGLVTATPSPQPPVYTVKEFLPIEIKQGFCQAYVSHIDTINNFYVQLGSQSDLLNIVRDEMSLLNLETLPAIENVLPGSMCCAKGERDEFYYRGIVVSVNDDKTVVRKVDYGNCIVTQTESLKALPSHVFAWPPLAVLCSFNNCVPFPNEESVDDSEFLRIVENKDLGAEIFTTNIPAKIELKLDGKLVSDILKEKNLLKSCEESVPQNSSLEDSQSYPPWFFPQSTEAVQMLVGHVSSFNQFFLQLDNKKNELTELGAELYNYYTANTELAVEEIYVGMPCVALYSEDEGWYRAEVKSMVDEFNVVVLFVDYGNDETVPLSTLRKLTPQFMSLPPFAVECKFKNLVPIEGIEAESFEHFKNITLEQQVIVNFLNLTNAPYDIEMYMNVEGQRVIITEKIFCDGYAHIRNAEDSSDAVIPEFLPTVPPKGSEKVYVSCAAAVDCIFLTLQSNEADLTSLASSLKSYAEEAPLVDNFVSGMACLSKFSKDDMWYRAEILSIHEPNATVKFVDYGNQDLSPLNGIKQINTDLLKIPPFAMRCYLNGHEAVANVFDDYKDLTSNRSFQVTFHGDEEPYGVDIVGAEINSIDIATIPIDGGVTGSEEASSDAVIMKFLPLISPKSSEEVYVAYAADLGNIFLSLQSNESKLASLANSLESYAEEAPLVDNFVSGMACLSKFSEDDMWYRAEILSIHEPNATVKLVDYGNQDVLPLKDIKQINPDLLKIPPFAIRCYLNGLASANQTVFNHFKELTCESILQATFHGDQEPFGVDIAGGEMYKHLDIATILIGGGVAETEELNQEMDEKESFNEIEVPLKSKTHGMVCHSVTPTELYVNLLNSSAQLDNMMKKLANLYSGLLTGEMVLENPSVGQACVALDLDDLAWYRCKVLEVTDGVIKCFFVDYGYVKIVNSHSLREIYPEFFTLPTQAIKCSLHGVKHLRDDETTWDLKVCDELSSLMEKNEVMVVFLIDFVEKSEDVIMVKLLDVGINIAKLLEEKGLLLLDTHKQFPSVSSSGQPDDMLLESPVIRPRSREDKIVPGTIAQGLVSMDEAVRDKLEREEASQHLEEKPVLGSVSFTGVSEVFSDPTENISERAIPENIAAESSIERPLSSSPIPRPTSREEKMCPGLLSRGLMASEQRIIELGEADIKTPKGHDEKILPGTLLEDKTDIVVSGGSDTTEIAGNSDQNGSLEPEDAEKISDESFPSEFAENLSAISESDSDMVLQPIIFPLVTENLGVQESAVEPEIASLESSQELVNSAAANASEIKEKSESADLKATKDAQESKEVSEEVTRARILETMAKVGL